MTDAEIITKIAELRGWKTRDRHTGLGTEGMLEVQHPERSSRVWWPGCHHSENTWNPLESIADAWELTGDLCSKGWTPTMAIRPFAKAAQDRYIFHGCMFEDGKRLKSFSKNANTAPRAICLAYLAAHGVGE